MPDISQFPGAEELQAGAPIKEGYSSVFIEGKAYQYPTTPSPSAPTPPVAPVVTPPSMPVTEAPPVDTSAIQTPQQYAADAAILQREVEAANQGMPSAPDSQAAQEAQQAAARIQAGYAQEQAIAASQGMIALGGGQYLKPEQYDQMIAEAGQRADTKMLVGGIESKGGIEGAIASGDIASVRQAIDKGLYTIKDQTTGQDRPMTQLDLVDLQIRQADIAAKTWAVGQIQAEAPEAISDEGVQLETAIASGVDPSVLRIAGFDPNKVSEAQQRAVAFQRPTLEANQAIQEKPSLSMADYIAMRNEIATNRALTDKAKAVLIKQIPEPNSEGQMRQLKDDAIAIGSLNVVPTIENWNSMNPYERGGAIAGIAGTAALVALGGVQAVNTLARRGFTPSQISVMAKRALADERGEVRFATEAPEAPPVPERIVEPEPSPLTPPKPEVIPEGEPAGPPAPTIPERPEPRVTPQAPPSEPVIIPRPEVPPEPAKPAAPPEPFPVRPTPMVRPRPVVSPEPATEPEVQPFPSTTPEVQPVPGTRTQPVRQPTTEPGTKAAPSVTPETQAFPETQPSVEPSTEPFAEAAPMQGIETETGIIPIQYPPGVIPPVTPPLQPPPIGRIPPPFPPPILPGGGSIYRGGDYGGFAVSTNLQGVVTDVTTTRPIPKATVQLVSSAGAKRQTKTDAKGRYKFVEINPDYYQMTVMKEAYEPSSFRFLVNLGENRFDVRQKRSVAPFTLIQQARTVPSKRTTIVTQAQPVRSRAIPMRQGVIAMKDGDFWMVAYPPFKPNNIVHMKTPPSDALVVKNIGQAYKTITSMGGNGNVLISQYAGSRGMSTGNTYRKPTKRRSGRKASRRAVMIRK